MSTGTHLPSAFLPRSAWAAVIVLFVGAVLVSACAKRLPSYRYRLTVEVQTPEGLRVGSSVVQVDTRGGSGIPDSGISSRVTGQAVAVDLGSRGTLFVLLSLPDDADWAAGIAPTVLLPTLVDRRGTAEAWGENLKALKKTKDDALVPDASYPLIVHFKNIADPRTIERVDPHNLAENFGSGVRLYAITIEITDDGVTKGIQRRFPWWKEYLKKHFDGTSTISMDVRDQNLTARLSSGSFSTET